MWLGIWLSSNKQDNAREMAAGIAEANLHPDSITRVVVGNEVLLRRDLSVGDLIADIDYVRARVKQPVAYADVTDFWEQFPEVAPHVDIVMIHFLPLLGGQAVGCGCGDCRHQNHHRSFQNAVSRQGGFHWRDRLAEPWAVAAGGGTEPV